MFAVAGFNSNLFLPAELSVTNKLAETATQIAIRNFEWRYITFVVFNSTLVCGANKLLQTYERSQIIGKGLFYPPFAEKTRQFVIFGSDITNIMYMLDWMQLHKFDNTGKHIIVCEAEPQLCNETDAVRILWHHKITNVVFLKRGYKKDEILGYSYFPLIEDCEKVRPVILDNLNSCTDTGENYYCSNMFPIKLKNLHKCHIVASTYLLAPYMAIVDGQPKGADGDLLQLISERLNATLITMTPRRGEGWGNLEENGTWSGSLGDVIDDVANFSMTSAAITLARFSQFQLSIDYYSTTVVWITHDAFSKPSSLKLLYPLQITTQMALFLNFMLLIFCAMFVKGKLWTRITRTINIGSSQDSNIIFNSWLVCMGQPINRLPSHQALLSIVILWVWYCLMIRTIYQVCLITVLRSNYYYSEFDTIEDAHAANYLVGGGVALRDYYIDYPLVYNEWKTVNINDIIPTLFAVSEGRKFVLAMNLECAMTLIRTRKLRVHILPQRLISSPTVLYFKKFSPLLQRVNHVLRSLIEFGFVDKTNKDNANTKLLPNTKGTQSPINMSHYTGCYAVLLSGWIASGITFILELGYNKFHRDIKAKFNF